MSFLRGYEVKRRYEMQISRRVNSRDSPRISNRCGPTSGILNTPITNGINHRFVDTSKGITHGFVMWLLHNQEGSLNEERGRYSPEVGLVGYSSRNP